MLVVRGRIGGGCGDGGRVGGDCGGGAGWLEVSGLPKTALPSKAFPAAGWVPTKKGFSKKTEEGGADGWREVVACGLAAVPCEVVQRRGGDREQGLRGRGVQQLPEPLRAKRKSGARKVREDATGSLQALRELPVPPVS